MSLFSALALERCHHAGCRFRTARTRFTPSRGIVLNGEWYCSAACFQAGLQAKSSLLLAEAAPDPPPKPHRVPLGLLLLSRGMIDLATLRRALEEQAATGDRIGDVLRALGAVTEQQITTAVASQWSCPVFPLRDHPNPGQFVHLLPLGLLQHYCALPVHFVRSTRVLHVAFAQTVSSTFLYAAQQMLSCTAQACFADESAILRALDQARYDSDRSEYLVSDVSGVAEMARVAVGFAQQLAATGARLLSCEDRLWLRLTRKNEANDFLFQFGAAVASTMRKDDFLTAAM
jgi:hypothetical protein